MNESCCTYEWVVPHVYIRRTLTCVQETTRKDWEVHSLWDMTFPLVGHDSLTCGTWFIHMWDMIHSHSRRPRVWMNHAPHVNESCLTYDWVISQDESRTTCEWVMPHLYSERYMWMSHVLHACEGVMSHIWLSNIAGWVTNNVWMSHGPLI